MLEKVESYVTYGYSNLKNVRDLIFKTGLEKLEKERVPLIDNNDIEQALGKHGILCLEDMVHESHTVGPHFKDATRFLWPFSLAKPEVNSWVRRIHIRTLETLEIVRSI
ncbi:60S ribosomal protein L7-3 [Bienertia sinuspersici]